MDLQEYDILDLQRHFASGALTSAKLTATFIQRIEQIDRSGPTLRSVIELNPDALNIASALDIERTEGGPRSNLHGVPILVKDAIDTADSMMTTAGSLVMEGNFAPGDAFVVQRLRKAGAVLLGKTNMSEWGYCRSTRGCSGWSSRGGQVRNPYVLDRSPSGSSSGSAVAVAANLCTAALGAEVDGSIVRPAAANGIVGLKPTVGLVSRAGVIGVSETQDTAGPMARSVADLAAMLTAIAGVDPRDPATVHAPAHDSVDYATHLDPAALRGARLGVAREYFGYHEGTDTVIEAAIAQLVRLGAEIVDPVRVCDVGLFFEPELELFLYTIKAQMNEYLKSHPAAPPRTLRELIELNRKHADRVMPFFQQELFEQAEQRGDLTETSYLRAKETCRRVSRTEGIDRAMADHRLDAIIAPTDSTPVWMIDPVNGDKLPASCATPPALAGYPHLTVPAGYVRGLPVGLSFFAGAFDEPKLIGYAFAFEQATKVRRPPAFAPSIPT